MNFADLRAAVSDRLGVPPAGDPLIMSAWLGAAVNTALQVCSSEKDWWWLLSSTTFQFNGGQAAMPSDLLKVEAIQAYSTYLEPVSRRDMLDQLNVPLPAPVGWTVIGNVLWLVPAPDGLIDARLLYYRAEPTLVGDADVPLMPAVFHDKLVAYAAYLGYLRRQDPVRATQQLADYQQWVKRTDADQSPVKGPRRVRIPRSQAPLAPPSSTLPAQPSISMGGVIVCTSTTRPLPVDGQLIFETDKRRLLQYEAAVVDWIPPRGVGFTTLATTPPAHSSDGELWFQGDTRKLVVRDTANAAWVPVYGQVFPCTSGTRPAAGLLDGQAIFETDTRRLLVWASATSTWRPPLGHVYVCTVATLPANPVEGQAAYTTDTDSLVVYTTATTLWQPPWNLPWGQIGENAAGNTDQTTITAMADVTSCTVTFTAVANRRYRVCGQVGSYFQSTTAGVVQLQFTDAANTALAGSNSLRTPPGVGSGNRMSATWSSKTVTPAAGSITYKMRAAALSGGAVTIENSQSSARLWVIDEGPAGAPA